MTCGGADVALFCTVACPCSPSGRSPRVTQTSTRPRRVSPADVRARLGEPEERIRAKILGCIDEHFHRFIAHSPS